MIELPERRSPPTGWPPTPRSSPSAPTTSPRHVGISRDDAESSFLASTAALGLVDDDPFVVLDPGRRGTPGGDGGRRGASGSARHRAGACGEHAGDPADDPLPPRLTRVVFTPPVLSRLTCRPLARSAPDDPGPVSGPLPERRDGGRGAGLGAEAACHGARLPSATPRQRLGPRSHIVRRGPSRRHGSHACTRRTRAPPRSPHGRPVVPSRSRPIPTEPSSSPRTPSRPRLPTTMSRALRPSWRTAATGPDARPPGGRAPPGNESSRGRASLTAGRRAPGCVQRGPWPTTRSWSTRRRRRGASRRPPPAPGRIHPPCGTHTPRPCPSRPTHRHRRQPPGARTHRRSPARRRPGTGRGSRPATHWS
jgi:hypothetical protein